MLAKPTINANPNTTQAVFRIDLILELMDFAKARLERTELALVLNGLGERLSSLGEHRALRPLWMQ